MNMATIRMELFVAAPAVETLELSNHHGTIQLPIDGQHVRVPYPWVKRAMELGWALSDPGMPWPPRRGHMCPPEELQPGDRVQLPDGSEIEISAPFNQAVEFPEGLVQHFESLGWTQLAQFA